MLTIVAFVVGGGTQKDITQLLTDLEQQISNRFQSANRVRCDKTRVSFQQIWIKIGWREVLSADLEGLVLRK